MPRLKGTIEQNREEIRKRERKLAKEKSIARRFNNPLKLFVEHRYKEVYNEYCELYLRMLSEYPSKRDLCQTKVFQQFLKNPKGEFENGNESEMAAEVLSEGKFEGNPKSACKDQEPGSSGLFVPLVELQPVVPIIRDEEPVASIAPHTDETYEEPNILVQALSETINGEMAPIGSIEFDNNVELVHSILEEMSHQAKLSNLINEAGIDLNEDEEIEMNYFDEFEKDIQLFNHPVV